MSESDFWQKSGHFGRKIYFLTDKIDNKCFFSIFSCSSLYEMIGIFIECKGFIERFTRVVEHDIEGLCIGAKLVALQITPFIADGTDCPCPVIFLYLIRLSKRCLVVHVKR
ncbi:MAG: hypothetical protein H6Q19_1 [Bacteroidetes bacterium]|nr:hypothetical protein [Bacteroidota bacterium]